MATAKKTATKKPNRKTTSKKPTAKKAAAKKTASKSAQANKVATKTVVTKSASAKRVLTPLERLRSMHVTMTFMYLFFSALTLVFVGAAGAQIYLSVMARDLFANTDQVVLAPAIEPLMFLEYRYVLVAALLVSAVGSLLLATKLRRRYEQSVTAGVSGMRWIITGLSAALTLEFVSLLAGIQDFKTLKVVSALIVATTLLGWLSDRENAASKGPKWLAFVASLFTGVMAWMPAAGSLIGTTLYNDERFGWHVYAVAFAALVGFTGFALNQYSQIKKKNSVEYVYFEQRHFWIDQATKFVIVLIIFSALPK